MRGGSGISRSSGGYSGERREVIDMPTPDEPDIRFIQSSTQPFSSLSLHEDASRTRSFISAEEGLAVRVMALSALRLRDADRLANAKYASMSGGSVIIPQVLASDRTLYIFEKFS